MPMLSFLLPYLSVCPPLRIAYARMADMYLFPLIIHIDGRCFSFSSAEMALTGKQTKHSAFTAFLRFLFQKLDDQVHFSFPFLFACNDALL